MAGKTKTIDIGLCTFRRPQVAETLRSLARLNMPENYAIRIIVADNDDEPSAKALVEQTTKAEGLHVSYIHAPARNISLARNACLEVAQAPYFAFIDDDEIADQHWLTALAETLESADADVVLGPVEAVYGPDAPDWMVKGDFHATNPVWVNGEIITGYSCNVLFKREADCLKGLRFRLDLGKSGGEDDVFFSGVYSAGGKIAFAPAAWVREAVPPHRAQFGWLFKRRFRFGQTHALLLRERQGDKLAVRAKSFAMAAVKAGVCTLVAVLTFWHPVKTRFWLLRGALHMGVMAGATGRATLEQYGETAEGT